MYIPDSIPIYLPTKWMHGIVVQKQQYLHSRYKVQKSFQMDMVVICLDVIIVIVNL